MSTNGTIVLATDPARDSLYNYVPTRSVAYIFVVLFGISTLAHTAQAIRSRMWWLFPTACLAGVGELVGWVSRLINSYDVTDRNAFITQATATVLAPIPLVAANFIIFGRLVTRLGPVYSRLPPRRYTLVFVSCDMISLFVQGGGGGLATSTDPSKVKLGTNIILAGIIFQLVMLSLYSALAVEYFVRYAQGRPVSGRQNDGSGLTQDRKAILTPKLRIMSIALGLNTFFLTVRAVYRTIELADGWGGKIMSTESYFDVFDGGMVLLAIYVFNFAHPGVLLAAEDDNIARKLNVDLVSKIHSPRLQDGYTNAAVPLGNQPDDEEKTICIIGAGPSGLAALKAVLDSPQYKARKWKPTAFEAREAIGGVWLPAPPIDDPPLTSLYDSLTTNLPHPVMAFSSYPFPPSTPLFPRASVVLRYLNDYVDHFQLQPHIQLNTAVTSVVREPSNWKVTLSTGIVLAFDLVIVCNGPFRVPRYPDTPGIAQWLTSGRASHAAWYRHPYNLGDTVLVVGGGPSGLDISAEMCTVARTVIHSVSGATAEDVGNLKRRGRVAYFGEDGQVIFEDGTVLSGIDHCILATGYQFSFPFFSPDFLRPEVPPLTPPLPQQLYNSTYSIFPLARHIFPLQTAFPPSSLAFLGRVLYRVAPFPLIEAQARAVLRVFAHPESLDLKQEALDVMKRYGRLRRRFGNDAFAVAKAWHRFEPLDQYDYRNAIYAFVASTDAGSGSVWNDTVYTEVPEWEKEGYLNRTVLRKAWVMLEQSGEAEAWVKGVAQGAPHDCVEMMQKLLKWAEQHGIQS
ncbi:putative FMO family protein [Lyophyllum shimeji]|uniref:FMO family protein n=1 Tax=Lyophyllum shimeji TaxID=47721 RepID=A0A9P3PUD2_LYOSH|nr:putative FMO family protein [Lyophyllum shimeji]